VVPERVVRDLAQPLRALSDSEALHAEAARLMRGFSVEQTPAELAKRAGFPADLPAGTRVYLTWIPGAPFERTLAAAVRVRELGMTPVPHLAARAIADAAALGRMLGELQREAGVEHLLLIAGSQRNPAGAYADSLQLLATGRFDGPPWRSLGFAAHPEGSPEIGALALSRALAAKSAHAAATSLPHELVTQFGFAAAPLLAWERQARTDSRRLPVRVGLAGLASVTTLLRYAAHCGVGASTRALLRHGGRSLRLTGAVAPGRLVAAVARARLADPDARFSGFHFYPFGSLDATVEWAAAIAAGAFTLDAQGRELVV
jgi:methylenetetrahydrofolate reductase (NADPH)